MTDSGKTQYTPGQSVTVIDAKGVRGPGLISAKRDAFTVQYEHLTRSGGDAWPAETTWPLKEQTFLGLTILPEPFTEPKGEEDECEGCVGTGTVQNPAGNRSDPTTWSKPCPDCNGRGWQEGGDPEVGSRPEDCTPCGNTGKVPSKGDSDKPLTADPYTGALSDPEAERLVIRVAAEDAGLARELEAYLLSGELRDVFERPFDGEDDPRLQLARVLTRTEAEAVLEYRGDIVAALSSAPDALSTTLAGQELVEAAKALIRTHEDTAGIDFTGWCQMVSAKVDDLRTAIANTQGG